MIIHRILGVVGGLPTVCRGVSVFLVRCPCGVGYRVVSSLLIRFLGVADFFERASVAAGGWCGSPGGAWLLVTPAGGGCLPVSRRVSARGAVWLVSRLFGPALDTVKRGPGIVVDPGAPFWRGGVSCRCVVTRFFRVVGGCRGLVCLVRGRGSSRRCCGRASGTSRGRGLCRRLRLVLSSVGRGRRWGWWRG